LILRRACAVRLAGNAVLRDDDGAGADEAGDDRWKRSEVRAGRSGW